MVKDSSGSVLLHSRFTFINVNSEIDAALSSLMWSIQIMRSHRFTKVIIAQDNKILTEVIDIPWILPLLIP